MNCIVLFDLLECCSICQISAQFKWDGGSSVCQQKQALSVGEMHPSWSHLYTFAPLAMCLWVINPQIGDFVDRAGLGRRTGFNWSPLLTRGSPEVLLIASLGLPWLIFCTHNFFSGFVNGSRLHNSTQTVNKTRGKKGIDLRMFLSKRNLLP